MFKGIGGAFQRLDRWLGQRPWAPTLTGLLWITFSVLLILQGLLRGFNLVTFIAAFLIAMWLLNMLLTLWSGPRLNKLHLKRRVLGTVHVGTPVLLSIEVENRGHSRSTGLRICEKDTPQGKTLGINVLQPGERIEFRQHVIPMQRGLFPWKPMLASSGNPFGLFRRSVTCSTDEIDTLVLPTLGQVDQQQFQRWLRNCQRASTLQTRTKARRSVAPADFYGIRSYRPGDSPRWIHWRTTARVGVPMVREFEEPPQNHITVLLDVSLPDAEHTLHEKWAAVRQQNLRAIYLHFRQFGAPSQEEVNYKLAELQHTEDPFAQPLHLVEQAVSLACTLCYLWTRRLGSTITLGVFDDRADLPVRLESGPNLRQLVPLMERLALAQATVQHDLPRIQRELEQRAFPPGPVILITPGTNSQLASMTKGLTRPVQLLDMSKTNQVRRFFHTQAHAVVHQMDGHFST